MAFNAAQTGNKIRSLREEKKWSQYSLGKQLNLTCAYVGKIERGEGTARVGVYVSMAELFDVPLDYLLTERPSEDPKKKLQLVIGILEKMEYDL